MSLNQVGKIMKTVKIIVLIVVCLYVGAYVGKENMNKGAEVAIQKTKVCYLWVAGTWKEPPVAKDTDSI